MPKKMWLLPLFGPMILGLVLIFIGPYLYPIYPSEHGELTIRFIPFLGGKGYQ
jgi:hypothetical protein